MVFASLIRDLFEFIHEKWLQELDDGRGTGIGASGKSGRGAANVHHDAEGVADFAAAGQQHGGGSITKRSPIQT
jgi:hypothetical protein